MVNFSYEDDLIEGTISSINEQHAGEHTKPEPFEVVIEIYGFSDTMLNIDPALILNKNQEFNGVLKPNTLSLMQETLDGNFDEYDDEIDDDDDGNDDNDGDYEDNDFDKDIDKIIEQGQRQNGMISDIFFV